MISRQLKPGDRLIARGGGGGGFGPAWERPVDKVREDVRQGYVTADAARNRYGVALDAETLAIDEEETARLRGHLGRDMAGGS